MSYDLFMALLVVIGVLSAVFFGLAIIADIAWPAIERAWRARRPRPQATYRRRPS